MEKCPIPGLDQNRKLGSQVRWWAVEEGAAKNAFRSPFLSVLFSPSKDLLSAEIDHLRSNLRSYQGLEVYVKEGTKMRPTLNSGDKWGAFTRIRN